MTVIEFANYAMVQQFVFFVLIVIVKRGIYIRRQAFSANPIIDQIYSKTLVAMNIWNSFDLMI